MVTAKCLQKIRGKNNQIIGYKLQDTKGNIQDFNSSFIKEQIRAGNIHIINMTLTSDNRLVDKKVKAQTQTGDINTTNIKNKETIDKESMQKYIQKAKLIGKLIEIPTNCKHKCYLISRTPENHILYIPDDVIQLNDGGYKPEFTNEIVNLEGHIKVIGGSNLANTDYMFQHCKVKSIDLSNFDTSKVMSMVYMFRDCKAQSIDFSGFNTSTVTKLHGMFLDCRATHLDLSSFDIGNVRSIDHMFSKCRAQSIKFGKFNTSNVVVMEGAFSECETQYLDLSSFDTRCVNNMKWMFSDCKAKSIKLSSFNTSFVGNMTHMFYCCEAQSLDLSNFDTRRVRHMDGMFSNCKAKVIDISNFETDWLEDINDMFLNCRAQIKARDNVILEELRREGLI